MKKSTLLVFGLVTQVGLFSCQEIYDDPSIKTNEDILVVQGMITNSEGPYTVRLSKTIPFNDNEFSVNSEETAVAGAEVIIRDDEGDFELLSEKEPGHYSTLVNGIKGRIGRTYSLFIRTKEGIMYQSRPRLLKPAPEITSLYSEQVQKPVIITKEDGTTNLENITGIGVYTDMTTGSVGDTFLKFEIRIIDEIKIINYLDVTYCWGTYYIKDRQNLKSLVNYSSNCIKKHEVCFLERKKFPPEALAFGAPGYYLEGRMVSLNAYLISEETYNFYSYFYQQLLADNSIFDPITVNLIGNIVCISDTSKMALGIFEASGKSIKHCLIKYNVGEAFAKFKDIDYIPENIMLQGCQQNERPSFWQEIL